MRHSKKERFERLKLADKAYEYAADVLKHWWDGADYGKGVAMLLADGVDDLVADMLKCSDICEYFGKHRNEHGFLVDQVWESFVSCQSYSEFKLCIKNLKAAKKSVDNKVQ